MPRKSTPFGPRYGSTLRKKYLEVWEIYTAPKVCPRCNKESGIRRIKIGLWSCKKCGAVFTGAAYTISSEIGKAIRVKTGTSS